ncbi:hypothetical protein LFL96_06510 [Paraburkholderia sp. D15]|uniref:hypothetical protein n=1 Tax=Paraburkholderia sp. D15 TaxID=2880218 RepID=UPI002478547E|nr:hypothetical protein [Paraburkholderia sp. D15]WGS51151.1 hypothetical protein LFL96_06510 [Paraburkholderia sp. D15]
MTSTVRGEELKRSDLAGGTIYIDAGVGIMADGYGASVMLLGRNPALLMMGIGMPQLPFFRLAISQATAVLVMRGRDSPRFGGLWSGMHNVQTRTEPAFSNCQPMFSTTVMTERLRLNIAALRALETAERCRSFTPAANELRRHDHPGRAADTTPPFPPFDRPTNGRSTTT